MDPITQQTVIAAAGAAAGGDKVYVDDVFSTYLTAAAGGQTITNGIDLSTEGGMVWSKTRTHGAPSAFHDTERGINKFLMTTSTAAQVDVSGTTNWHSLTSFNTDGFTTGGDNYWGYTDYSGYGNFAHWSFRKAPGFFDVVTYTGDGNATKTINHSLGSVPGMIIVKKTSGTGNWITYHRSTGATKWVLLNTTDPSQNGYGTWPWHNTTPTSTQFTVSLDGSLSVSNNDYKLNLSGETYVAYVFAHDEPVFGTDEDESIIKCGTFNIPGSGTFDVNLGFEPQFILYKQTSGGMGTPNWHMHDTMRGLAQTNFNPLYANTSDTESPATSEGLLTVNPLGFKSTSSAHNAGDYIYMAIRRPNKPPTAGTEVYKAIIGNDTNAMSTGFTVDMSLCAKHDASYYNFLAIDRLRGGRILLTNDTHAEYVESTFDPAFATNDGLNGRQWFNNAAATNHFFKRAPGFFDIVAYTANYTNTPQTFSHNLGAVPELIFFKTRDSSNYWYTYAAPLGNTKTITLDLPYAASTSTTWLDSTTPTSSVFTLKSTEANWGTKPHVAYLFASLPGISKVGSYTGTGNAINVDCGFSSGARFILIKRHDATGDWYLWNHADGIVSGNDPYQLVNSRTASQVTNTDYIDPLTSGFTVTSSAPDALNVNGGNYIFLAIA